MAGKGEGVTIQYGEALRIRGITLSSATPTLGRCTYVHTYPRRRAGDIPLSVPGSAMGITIEGDTWGDFLK